ncbi:hypothetical protein AGLY_016487 [Aphis glycines]|uniref:Retrotransposon gag domain-containing protein n=1 Tax=Aphis glycines TaxID=307491 RepID=A0A6G0SXR7_APHGL|nr:hypothetical protein AGLY_016487 [Aphis glycines]
MQSINISDNLKPTILEAILAQLKDNAFEAVRYKEIHNWKELKKIFRTVFGSAHSVSYLQVQLNQMRQNAKESYIKDKSSIKCHRYERLGHYANECRTSEHKLPSFRNPNSGQSTSTEIKKEYSSKFCKYCKKTNHDISECRMLKDKKKLEEGNNESNENRSIEEIQSGNKNRIRNEHN